MRPKLSLRSEEIVAQATQGHRISQKTPQKRQDDLFLSFWETPGQSVEVFLR